MISFGLHSRWMHPKYTWSRNDVGSSRSTFFHQLLPHGTHYSASCQPFSCRPHRPIIQVTSWGFAQPLCTFICQVTRSSNALFRVTFPCRRTTRQFFREVSPALAFFSCSSRNSWFEHVPLVVNNILVGFAFTLSTSQVHVVKKWRWFSKIDPLSSTSSTWEPYFASFQPCWCRPRIPTRTILVSDKQNKHSQFGTFSHACPNRTSPSCLYQKSPANGCPHKYLSRETTGSSILFQDLDHLCRERRIHISGNPDSGTLSNLGASSIFTWV